MIGADGSRNADSSASPLLSALTKNTGHDEDGSWYNCAVMERESITVDLVSRLVAAQFPQWADLRVVPVTPGGVDNMTFRLGEGLSARLPTDENYARQVDKEQRGLAFLAPRLPKPDSRAP